MNIDILNGLSDIVETYDHFIIDIFGVIHDGIRPYPLTIDTLQKLKRAGKQICLLSNSPRRVKNVRAHLRAMGIDESLYGHAVTSGEATWQALNNRDPALGQRCWFIGNAHGSEVLYGQNLSLTEGPQDADFILNSIPGTEGTARSNLLRDLEIAAKRNLPMICANPDLVVNIGAQQYECAGIFAALYERMGGRVEYHGKPHGPVYSLSYDLLGKPLKKRICAIGDSFHTDITGAKRFEIDSILNLVGIHWDEIESDDQLDEDKLERLLRRSTTHPTYIMTGLGW